MSTPPKPKPLPPPIGGRIACAACKHQRRRCAADCPLAPYFPADRPSDFHNVHRLFGLKYVARLLRDVAPRHRDDAARSLVYEANLRAMHPVAGCCAAIAELLRQIDLCNAHLKIITQNLAFYKQEFLMRNFDAYHNQLILNDQDIINQEIQENVPQQFFHHDNKPNLPHQ